jgi:sugar O-acyltransferase (sialic acid O-acetyltransferase NeuD family)
MSPLAEWIARQLIPACPFAELPVLFGIVGAGGFGREVLPIARAAYPTARFTFVETTGHRPREVNGIPVIGADEFLSAEQELRFALAIADHQARATIANRFIERDAIPVSLRAASSQIGDRSSIGQGDILCTNVVITANATIGRFFHANIGSYVAHDCVIGDFVTFAPMVCCNGNVTIGDGAYIGTGAMLRQGSSGEPLTIGAGAVIGMGSVVTRNVPANETWVGNPARKLRG